MKILYFTKYSRLGASSRLRSYQFFPFLEKKGFIITVKPLFDDNYLKKKYLKKNLWFEIVCSYFKRFISLFQLFKYDKIVIEKELFPYLPPFFERFLHLIGIEYIVDFDDAIFHNYDLNSSNIIKFFLSGKIDSVMKFSSCVVVGNTYLMKRATASNAKRIEIIPTVIDLNKYYVKEKKNKSKTIIGWIGSPSTFKYVKSIKNALQKISDKYPIEIHIIGANEKLGIEGNVKYFKWNEQDEVDKIQNFDIGIMPLDNSPWELGKCSYKLIQYMGCGIPVIASAVGMNNVLINHLHNGLLAKDRNNWYNCIEKLINDNTFSEYIGNNGRLTVEDNYTVNSKLNKIIQILYE